MIRDGFEPNKMYPVIYDLPSPVRHINKKKVIIIIAILIILLIMYFIFKKPTVFINGEKVEKVSYKTEFVDKGITVIYHFKNITNEVIVTNNVNTNNLGEYEIVYKIPYWFGTYTYKRQVKVIDDISPEIQLQGDTEYKVSYKKEYQEPGYAAIDNYDGDITEKVEVNTKDISPSEKEYYYSVSDSNGNKQQVKRKVIFIDDIPPKVEINGEGTIFLNVGDTYEEQGATAIDEKDGELTEKLEITSNVDTNQVGTYVVRYSVPDNSGNIGIADREIVVGGPGRACMKIGTPKTIYLTFDDGPSAHLTPAILDILRENNIKATFFILDYGANTEPLVKQIVEEGHSIGIHSASHDYKVAYANPEAYLSGIDYMKEKIKSSTGVETNLIRFPGGSSNTISRKYCPGVMTALVNETVNRGYRYFDWNVMSGDSGDTQTAEEVYNNVTNGLRDTISNVILMHDFNGNNKTLEALPSIIKYALDNGYTFEKITNKTPMVTQNVQN